MRSGYRDIEGVVEADVGDSFDVGQKAEKMLVGKFNHSDDNQQCYRPKMKRDDSIFVIVSVPRLLFSAFLDSRFGPLAFVLIMRRSLVLSSLSSSFPLSARSRITLLRLMLKKAPSIGKME